MKTTKLCYALHYQSQELAPWEGSSTRFPVYCARSRTSVINGKSYKLHVTKELKLTFHGFVAAHTTNEDFIPIWIGPLREERR